MWIQHILSGLPVRLTSYIASTFTMKAYILSALLIPASLMCEGQFRAGLLSIEANALYSNYDYNAFIFGSGRNGNTQQYGAMLNGWITNTLSLGVGFGRHYNTEHKGSSLYSQKFTGNYLRAQAAFTKSLFRSRFYGGASLRLTKGRFEFRNEGVVDGIHAEAPFRSYGGALLLGYMPLPYLCIFAEPLIFDRYKLGPALYADPSGTGTMNILISQNIPLFSPNLHLHFCFPAFVRRSLTDPTD
jgi:hypothetical protein